MDMVRIVSEHTCADSDHCLGLVCQAGLSRRRQDGTCAHKGNRPNGSKVGAS